MIISNNKRILLSNYNLTIKNLIIFFATKAFFAFVIHLFIIYSLRSHMTVDI